MPSQPLELAELSERLKRDERLLGLDVGTKTIGLASSDVMRRIATPLETIRRTKFSADAARLLELAKHHGVGGLVIGLPVNLDGSEGPRAQSTRAFARNLAAADRFADGVLGRAAFDRRRRARAAGSRYQPQAPRRTHRQDGRRLHPAGRAGSAELWLPLSCMIANSRRSRLCFSSLPSAMRLRS